MNIHFIAIGGAAMHNLAIALHLKGYHVTGSDDEIFDPARSHLKQYGLLPESEGWHPERITPQTDAVILGMHAHEDNPELQRAKALGIKIYSYPEYLYSQSTDKTRIVVGGSHGKTTTTAMILHALTQSGINADYMVGAKLKGFDVMVRLSEAAKVIVIEGDEYLTSPLDRRSKFLHYHPNVAIITGIKWDHANVFPTFDSYLDTFARFIDSIEPGGTLIYCDEDSDVHRLVENTKRSDITFVPYEAIANSVVNGTTFAEPEHIALQVFGHHNMMNLSAAMHACHAVGINNRDFLQAASSFNGVSGRLELLVSSEQRALYKDFAHAPSKLKATVEALNSQYPERTLVACMELHTYSSLSANFLEQYRDSMLAANYPIVYFNPHAIELKRLKPITKEQIRAAFNDPRLEVYDDSQELLCRLQELSGTLIDNYNILMMSSGNFGGLNLNQIADIITKKLF